MTTFSIAGLQLEAVNGDNVESMLSEIDKVVARSPWVDMVVLAELNACGTDVGGAEPMPGPTEDIFCEVAHRHGIWLVPGSIHELNEGNIYNTCPVINPDGKVISRARKLFPWLPYENDVTPGDQFSVFDVPGVGRFGMSLRPIQVSRYFSQIRSMYVCTSTLT